MSSVLGPNVVMVQFNPEFIACLAIIFLAVAAGSFGLGALWAEVRRQAARDSEFDRWLRARDKEMEEFIK